MTACLVFKEKLYIALVAFAGQWQPDGEAATKAGAAEHMLLAALVELYHDARENDVRLGILRISLQALQRHGANLCHRLPHCAPVSSYSKLMLRPTRQ